ncbi:tyrosine-type recombinase/integrase [Sinorhizobium medicae]|uniref:tyrosine-type recombinase/integrase n=1 Tax=Sinorhizobium medicae TaxID=110321 RepID=UPI000408213E|nr:site-specific integrase [Sinorhizobium medicae]
MAGTVAGGVVALKIAAEKVALTQAIVDGVTARQKRYEIYDSTLAGFRLVVQPSGARAFYLWTRIGKGRGAKAKYIHVGDAALMKLKDARARASAMALTARAGDDPVVRVDVADRLESHLDAYERSLEARGVVKTTDIMWSLRAYLKPKLKDLTADLKRADITGAMAKLEGAGKPGAAEYFRKCASSFLNWAVNEGHLQASPLAGYRRERATKHQRQRVEQFTMTTAGEIRDFWTAAAAAKTPVGRDLLRFLLLTGQRRTETALIRWSHIDLEAATWRIPAAITKTGVAHTVHLGPESLALLKAQPRLAGCPLVFPGRNLKPIGGWSKLLEPVRKSFGNTDLSPHGLRRTYRTTLAELGVEEAVAERMIAHKRSDLVSLYDKSQMTERRIEAQAVYEAHVKAVVA